MGCATLVVNFPRRTRTVSFVGAGGGANDRPLFHHDILSPSPTSSSPVLLQHHYTFVITPVTLLHLLHIALISYPNSSTQSVKFTESARKHIRKMQFASILLLGASFIGATLAQAKIAFTTLPSAVVAGQSTTLRWAGGNPNVSLSPNVSRITHHTNNARTP